MLRPGNAPTSRGALALLTRLLGELQERYPQARILVRLDGGFAGPELLTFLDEVCVDYVVGLPGNPRLERLAAPYLDAVRLRSALTGTTEHDYADARYAARSWDRERRVVIKAKVVQHPGREAKNNPRFVVTNLADDPRRLYERVYCQRGVPLRHAVAAGRTRPRRPQRIARHPVLRLPTSTPPRGEALSAACRRNARCLDEPDSDDAGPTIGVPPDGNPLRT